MARIGDRTSPGRFSLGSWKNLEVKDAQEFLEHQVIAFDRLTVVRCVYRRGVDFPEHFHPQEQITIVEEGALEFEIGGEKVRVRRGETISVAPGVPHATRVSNGSERVIALNLFLKSGREASPTNGTGIGTVVRPTR